MGLTPKIRQTLDQKMDRYAFLMVHYMPISPSRLE